MTKGKSKKVTFFISLVSILICLPMLSILTVAVFSDKEVFIKWLGNGLLWDYFWRTLVLMLGTSMLSALIGCTLAWISVFCTYPFKRVINFMLLLPFIVPPWIMAWVWKDFFDYTGEWHSFLKYITPLFDSLDINYDPNRYVIPINNLVGGIFILAFALYPYIYFLCRVNFLRQSKRLFEVSRLLKANKNKFFFKVSLPMARPGLMAGIMLVMMEVLSDYGTVKYLSLPVLSLAVEKAWLDRGDFSLSACISLVGMLLAFILAASEQYFRKKQSAYNQDENQRTHNPYIIRNKIILVFFFIPIFVGFIYPVYRLLTYAFDYFRNLSGYDSLISSIYNSIILSSASAIVTVFLGILLVWAIREGSKLRLLINFSSLGYAVPSLILAVGVLLPASILDKYLYPFIGIALVGSIFLLIYGWAVRFLVVATGNLDSGFSRIDQSLIEAASILGHGSFSRIIRIYLPLLKGFILTASIMVFVDTLKELAIAMMLRPFGLELLSVYVWQFGSLEQLEEAAPGALILIGIGIFPLIFLYKQLNKN